RRLRRLLFLPSPRFSLLLWAAAPPLLFASPLALLSGGCAALPLQLLFRFFGGCAASLSPALSWAACAAPSLPSLFPLYQTINNPFRYRRMS
ncbi:MAG: hypothetical protein J6W88_02440, partial [Bacteroidales bacterium]|nr:hypothetical protein [Bacteroidales bacterium]